MADTRADEILGKLYDRIEAERADDLPEMKVGRMIGMTWILPAGRNRHERRANAARLRKKMRRDG